MKRSSLSHGVAARWTLWTLWVLVPFSALAVGGAPVPVVAAVAMVAAACGILASRSRASRRGPRLGPALVLAALSGLCALQAIPLPLSILEKLDVATADVWARSLLPIGRVVHFGTLSLDPGASIVEAAKWATYACVLFASATLARARGARACLELVAVSSVVVALATVGHQLVEAKKVFGIYEPLHAFGRGAVGPLLNPNHLAGYLNLGALCALGLALSPRGDAPRWVMSTIAVVDVAVSLRTASRGGAAALLLGLLILGALVALAPLQRKDPTERRRRAAGLTIILTTAALGVGLAAFGFDTQLWAELADPGTGKFKMISWLRPMLSDHLFLGIGRGAFESVFEAYRPPTNGHVVFTHPENFLAQWLCEWGILGGVAMVLFIWLFRPWRLGLLRSTKAAGAAAAGLTLLAHNLVDFSLEVPGVAIAFATVMGALWGNARTGDDDSARRDGAGSIPILSMAAWTAATGIAAVLLGMPTVALAREQLRRGLESGSGSRDGLVNQVVHQMGRHPADYYFPLVGGALAMRNGDNPMPWIQRALERGPTIGRTHLLLAEVLARRGGRAQAIFELRLAVEYESTLAVAASESALRWTRKLDELLRVAPEGVDGADVLETMAGVALGQNDGQLATALDREVLKRSPRRRAPLVQLAQAALQSLSEDRCDDRITCEDELRQFSSELVAAYPSSSIGEQLRARFAVVDGDPLQARSILRQACKKPDDVSECLRLLVAVEDPREVASTVERYLAVSCPTNQACAEALDWVASFHESRGSWAQAFGAADKAARQVPTELRWMRAADLAERAGQRLDAARALEQVLHFRTKGDNPELRRRIEQDRHSEP